MSRTSTEGWDNQQEEYVNLKLPIVNWSKYSKYSVEAPNKNTNSCLIKNVTAYATDSLDESVSFDYRNLDSVSGMGLKKLYKPSTKNGFEFTVSDKFVRRTIDSYAETPAEDSVQVSLMVKAPNGSNIISGTDVLGMILHMLGFVVEIENVSGSYVIKEDQQILSSLLSGGVVPYTLA